MMKQITANHLNVGNIFTKEVKLHNREAFLVKEVPKGKNYKIVESRNTNKTTKMFLGESEWITLLHE